MMYKLDKLTLISGIDIPIPEMKVNIHQPRIKEIAYIGERNFFIAVESIVVEAEKFLFNSAEILSEEDKVAVSQMSNFQLFMTMVGSDPMVEINAKSLFTLLFPDYQVQLEERFIIMTSGDGKPPVILDENNFSVLQDVVKTIFCLNFGKAEQDLNPAGNKAREIAEKIKRGRAKAAASKGEKTQASSFISKYVSSLCIGTNTMSLDNMLSLTLYQLFDLIERFRVREQFSMSIQAKMAGAKDVEDVDWLKDIE